MRDAAAWRRELEAARSAGDRARLAGLRQTLFYETVEIVERGHYDVRAEHGDERVLVAGEDEVRALGEGTRLFASTEELVVPAAARARFATQVHVVGMDVLEAARLVDGWYGREERWASGEGPSEVEPPEVCVLNMANALHPGGGVLQGAGAQEESLFRRTNLHDSLFRFVEWGVKFGVEPDAAGARYPILPGGAAYSPSVSIFRGPESSGYRLLMRPRFVSVVSVAALERPPLLGGSGSERLLEPHAEETRARLRAILRVAASGGHEQLVLSAFGCGAFQNPAGHMAELFEEVLYEDEFRGVFRRVVFAIIEDEGRGGRGHLVPFLDRLDGLVIEA